MDILAILLLLFNLLSAIIVKIRKRLKRARKLEEALAKQAEKDRIDKNIFKATGKANQYRQKYSGRPYNIYKIFYDHLSEEEKNQIREQMINEFGKRGKAIDFETAKRKAQRIFAKRRRGIKPTEGEELFLKVFKDFLLKTCECGVCGNPKAGQEAVTQEKPIYQSGCGSTGGNDLNKWTKIHSSWLLEGKFSYLADRKTGNFYCRMIRSVKVYVFPDFPVDAFLELATVTEHAGTLFWKKNLWRYSLNYGLKKKQTRHDLSKQNFNKDKYKDRKGKNGKN